jgi:DNA/RNA-binding protein KIN17
MQDELAKRSRPMERPIIDPVHPEPPSEPESDGEDEAAWLSPGLIVKILSKKLQEGALYKQKARIVALDSEFVGTLELVSDGTRLRLDQVDLETVVPGLDGRVRIVLGQHTGQEGVLKQLVVERFLGRVLLDGDVGMREFPYEHFCKVE